MVAPWTVGCGTNTKLYPGFDTAACIPKEHVKTYGARNSALFVPALSPSELKGSLVLAVQLAALLLLCPQLREDRCLLSENKPTRAVFFLLVVKGSIFQRGSG